MNTKARFDLPKWAQSLLYWVLPRDKREILIGDFAEDFFEKANAKGRSRAVLWFWGQFLASVPAFIHQTFNYGRMMLKNYFKIAFRNLYRNFGYAALNLMGLAMGIAAFVVIMLYVRDEASFDTFHKEAERIYRVLDFRKVDGIGEESTSATIPLGENMVMDYPDQIEGMVRFFNFQAPTLALAYVPDQGKARQFNEQSLYFVDPDFFEVFNFPLARGNAKTALTSPNQIVITQEMARKYFGDRDLMGRLLRFEDKHDLVVSGVFEELPKNTHLKFEGLISFVTLDNPEVLRARLRTGWIWNPAWTYLKLAEGVDPQFMETQFPDFVVKHFHESRHDRVKLYLQPLTDIHLKSNLDYEMGPNSDVSYIYIFTTVAVFILLISCINFINLTTARSTRRAREIGLRKVFGGYRLQLIWQFLTESVVMSGLALLLSFPLIWILVPVLNAFSGKALVFAPFSSPELLLGMAGLSLLIGLISGLYPAFVLSAFRPALAVKGERQIQASKGALLRKVLVTGQFTLSIVLIIGTAFAIRQLNFLQSQSLGFDQEKVLLLPTLRSPLMQQYNEFKASLLTHSAISGITTVEDIPGMKHQTGGYHVVGREGEQQFPRLIVHNDFIKTLGIELITGRGYTDDFKNDAQESVIINETMVKLMGWESPADALGKDFSGETVVGVTSDFHFASLHRPIGPFVIEKVSDNARAMEFSCRYIAVRMNEEAVEEVLTHIEEKWFEFTPNRPFEYLFLEDLLGDQYEAEATLGKVAAAFAGLSVLIACLGLFGLASYTAENRRKEIGIRKVMGAAISQILLMLSKDFVKLALISTVLAWPLAFLALNAWLGDFAYRTQLNAWPFVWAGAIALFIIFITVSYQTIRTARSNPADTLRHE